MNPNLVHILVHHPTIIKKKIDVPVIEIFLSKIAASNERL